MGHKIYAYVEPHYPIKKSVLITTAQTSLETAKIRSRVEISISIVGDRKIKQLNKQFRGIDAPTDVLAFPYSLDTGRTKEFVSPPSKYLFLGDIIISYPQLIDRAADESVLVDEMASLLVTHGVLHLLGFDHEKPEETASMESIEDKVLSTLRPTPEIIK